MCLRVLYLQHFIAQELKQETSSNKLNVSSLLKANLQLFANEQDPHTIQKLSALDVVMSGDAWATTWSSALECASGSNEIIQHLSKNMNLDTSAFLQKMNLTLSKDGAGKTEATENWKQLV